MKSSIVLAVLAFLCGCASLSDSDHASRLNTAAEDDEYCTVTGVHYPQPAYIGCRLRLDNDRLYKQWRAMGMMRGSSGTISNTAAVSGPQPRFIPLDASRYTCWPDPQFGTNYIICGVQGG